jgi:transcriptional regulator with XRE-family HTH domain
MNVLATTVICHVSNIVNKEYVKALGRRVIALRNEKGLSQEELANLADIPVNQVGRVERGEINTTVSTIYALSKALKVGTTEIYDFPFKEKK